MNFKSLSVNARIWTLTIVFLASMSIVGSLTYRNTQSLAANLLNAADVELPAVQAITLADMAHDGIRASVFRALIALEDGDKEALSAAQAEGAEFVKNFQDRLNEIEKLALDESVKTKISETRPKMNTYSEIATKILNLAVAADLATAKSHISEFQKSFKDLEESMGKLGDDVETHAKENLSQARTLASKAERISIIVLFVGMAFGILFALWISVTLRKNLSSIVKRISDEAIRLSSSAAEVNESSQRLSESTTEQAASIEQTVSSMEEMASMIKQTSQNAMRTLAVCEESKIETNNGKDVVGRMTQAMAEIEAENSKLEKVTTLIAEISNKTRVINEIVFETRLLSFNASIEAARAGVHGKGFAVVAEEVGKLAAMSGRAADEIRTLLESSTAEVNTIVRDTKDRVGIGRQVSTECESTFAKMGETLERISEAVNLITAAAKEQEVGVRQTNVAMNEMDKVTQRNSRGAEYLSTQANNLADASTSIRATVSELNHITLGTELKLGESEKATKARSSSLGEEDTKVSRIPARHEVKTVNESEVSRNDSRWKDAS